MSPSRKTATIKRRLTGGFSLLELTVVMVILGVLFSGGTTLMLSLIEQQSREATELRLNAVQKALLNYASAYGHLPCPADLRDNFGSASYGNGTGSGDVAPGNCSAATYSHVNGSGQTTVEGLVPIKQLSLPDEYAVDGYGRRFFYIVSQHMTAANALADHPAGPTAGTIIVLGDTMAPLEGRAVYALISAGKNGHGAFSRDGGAARVDAGSADAAEQENCAWNGVSSTFNETVVQKRITAGYDDITRFLRRESLGYAL